MTVTYLNFSCQNGNISVTMPYIIGQSEVFIGGVSLLIIVLLMLRFYIAKKIKRQAKKNEPPTQHS